MTEKCVNCNKEINFKSLTISFCSMREKEKKDYACEDCWNKNKNQYLKDYSRIFRSGTEDDEEMIKFIKLECRKCGTSFLCESEESKKHAWKNNKCVNYDYEKGKIIDNNFESNKPTQEVKSTKNNDGEISGIMIAFVFLLIISVSGMIGYFIWKRSKN